MLPSLHEDGRFASLTVSMLRAQIMTDLCLRSLHAHSVAGLADIVAHSTPCATLVSARRLPLQAVSSGQRVAGLVV
jgi:hypothetical protein